MKNTDFDKKIKITPLSNNDILAFELKSILYTPHQYRIPLHLLIQQIPIDDTEKYIAENYTIEESRKIKA